MNSRYVVKIPFYAVIGKSTVIPRYDVWDQETNAWATYKAYKTESRAAEIADDLNFNLENE